jgi:hypothetical protein
MAELDAEKLKENALTSIRLGIEDFQRTKQTNEQGGDPARALSVDCRRKLTQLTQ